MTNGKGSQNEGGTSSENLENGDIPHIIEPFVLRPDEIYSKEYLTQAMSLSKNTFTTWKKRGLVKLNTNTKQDLYFGSDIILMFRSPT